MSDADTMGMDDDEVTHLEQVEKAKEWDSYTAREVDTIRDAVLRGLRKKPEGDNDE